ncbi:SRPBCC family protein [Pelagibacterium sp.]|uniref:SRPBCC family protein n=1 Tax=Pelagibacterium sp. TaxID=1967288 RepID=UPI003BABD268
MAVDVETSIEMEAPLEAVAGYAMDPDNAPLWYANIKSITWRTDPPLAVGSRLDFVAQFLGRRLAYTYEVVECVADERLVMRTTQGPFPMQTSYRFEAISDRRTRMILRNSGEPAGFARLTAPIMASAMRAANRKDLAKLKRLVEDLG